MKLGLLAIFRNEAHILDEFIQHYKQQGVDHFYLINNASEDNYETILNKYSDIITLKHEPYLGPSTVLELGGRQLEAYNELLPEITTDWLYICDLDEFAYGQQGFTLKTFLETHGTKFEQVLLPLKTFSSNNQVQQPASVVRGFTQRRVGEKYTLYKPIVKTAAVARIRINYCTLKYGTTVDAALTKTSNKFVTENARVEEPENLRFRDISATGFDQALVVSNHYTVQSYNWFFNVKATRGTATWHGGPKIEAKQWFQQVWDKLHKHPMITDTVLLDITKNDPFGKL